MKHPNALSRTLGIAAAVVLGLGALTVGATGCSLASGLTGVTPYTPAQTPAPAMHASGTGTSATGAGTSAAACAPTPAAGRAVVEQSCVGRCHGPNLLNYRTSQTGALRLAASMGSRAGLSVAKQQAVATFFAQ